MTPRPYSTAVALVVSLTLVGPVTTVLAADEAYPRVRAAIHRRTPIADSARRVAIAARDGETVQPPPGPITKSITCVIGFTVFPLTGALLGLIAGATGALATGNSLSDGAAKGSMVVGGALGVAVGAAVCVK